MSGAPVPGANPGDVALRLHDLLPFLDDASFDRFMAKLQRDARFVTMAELAAAENTVEYADAAWAAGLDASDFPNERYELGGDVVDYEAFRSAVIEHWDLDLRADVDRMLEENSSLDPLVPRRSTQSHTG
ncbi:hypothetical protein [Nocardioides sp. CER19]|uniref:hypothetical protein n=1 Tax=Nocardioides sp. CER19 TaxID=3038538 RepID=UPI0024487507|nr:hypothetical protein [Nocardioides sp. CER19]MDH2413834.1 hypothetical protein [Nocardioides sp. CER19]